MKRIYQKTNYKDLKLAIKDSYIGMMIALQTAIFLLILFMMLNDV
jgi:hypothetical protein